MVLLGGRHNEFTIGPNDAADQTRWSATGPVATIFVLLFLAGLYPVTIFGGQPYFSGPWESTDTIVTFFQTRPTAVLLCTALHFGAAIPLGIFTASVVSRLQFLGVRAAGAWIALFGGFATAFTMLASSSVLWVLAQPGITQDRMLPRVLLARPGIQWIGGFGAVWSLDRRHLGSDGISEATTQVDRDIRACARGLR